MQAEVDVRAQLCEEAALEAACIIDKCKNRAHLLGCTASPLQVCTVAVIAGSEFVSFVLRGWQFLSLS